MFGSAPSLSPAASSLHCLQKTLVRNHFAVIRDNVARQAAWLVPEADKWQVVVGLPAIVSSKALNTNTLQSDVASAVAINWSSPPSKLQLA